MEALEVSWQKVYDMYSIIEYVGQEGYDYYFKITRRQVDGVFDPEVFECMIMTDGEKIAGAECEWVLNTEEARAIRNAVKELLNQSI